MSMPQPDFQIVEDIRRSVISSDTLLSLIDEELGKLGLHGSRILINRIHEHMATRIGREKCAAPIRLPMTNAEVAEFKEKIMPYGKYANWKMGEIDLNYLEWLADSSKETCETLWRYLNNPTIKQLRNIELETG